MKLYFYYLKDGKLNKEAVSNVRENSRSFVIPAGGKAMICGLFEYKIPKNCCEIVQIDGSIYRFSPYILSKRNDLDCVSGICDLLNAIQNNTMLVNAEIDKHEGGRNGKFKE